MKPSEIQPEETSANFQQYIDLVPDQEICSVLKKNLIDITAFLKSLPEEKWEFRYAPNKWTIKEMMQHVIDTERIFAYRALRIARHDKTPIHGFEQDNYIAPSKANNRKIDSILDEYKTNREATVALFRSFDKEMWPQIGEASGRPVSARAAACVVAGHELHHIGVIKERYL